MKTFLITLRECKMLLLIAVSIVPILLLIASMYPAFEQAVRDDRNFIFLVKALLMGLAPLLTAIIRYRSQKDKLLLTLLGMPVSVRNIVWSQYGVALCLQTLVTMMVCFAVRWFYPESATFLGFSDILASSGNGCFACVAVLQFSQIGKTGADFFKSIAIPFFCAVYFASNFIDLEITEFSLVAAALATALYIWLDMKQFVRKMTGDCSPPKVVVQRFLSLHGCEKQPMKK